MESIMSNTMKNVIYSLIVVYVLVCYEGQVNANPQENKDMSTYFKEVLGDRRRIDYFNTPFGESWDYVYLIFQESLGVRAETGKVPINLNKWKLRIVDLEGTITHRENKISLKDIIELLCEKFHTLAIISSEGFTVLPDDIQIDPAKYEKIAKGVYCQK